MRSAHAITPTVPCRDQTAASRVYFDGWSDRSLASVLRVPAVVCLDERCPDFPQPLPSTGLTLWISTRAAAKQGVATEITGALCDRAPWTRSKRLDIETAFQEAIGNAIIHGNLGISSAMRHSLDGLAEFGRALAAGLADDVLGGTPILVHGEWSDQTLSLSVEDRGRGFTPSIRRPRAPDEPCGRGLLTIHALCDSVEIDRGGRRIAMTFNR